MTTAEQVAKLLGDGQRWEADDGRTLDDLAAEHGWDVEGSRPWSWVGLPEQDQTCAYCGVHTPEVDDVPDADDDEAWERISIEHEQSCEWVHTRAHRIND